jgi:hypothetical protein
MGEIDDEGRVAPRRLVVEYPAERFSCDKSLLRVEYRRLTSAKVF